MALNEEVRNTPELRRILSLPRRAPVPAPDLAATLTELLRTPAGSMQLRPMQALALHDIGVYGGAFCPLGVGLGKTIISLMSAYVLDARAPLLMMPANLIQKTNRERAELAKHWRIPNHVRLMSYEMLGRVQAAGELDAHKPDLIIADEVHRLKNRRAAVTRRVARYMHEFPATKFVGLSGTIMRKSLLEFGHILRWCLKTNAPIPATDVELEEWASALDEDVSGRPGDELGRLEPGALYEFCSEEEIANDPPLTAARNGFRRRLVETPGIVASTSDIERVDCSIYIRALRYKVKPITEQHFRTLRTAWETPDGWPLSQGVDVWRHARELALGLHYVWDPRPPRPWMEARRAWAAFVRETLSRSRTLDSELQVAQAVAAGRLDDGGALEAWQKIRDTFIPNSVPVWHDDSALHAAAEWMKTPGIVWTEHSFFAERLAKETGAAYYGAQGLDARGRFIDDADGTKAIIASIDANREGRNLQLKWSRNLVVSPPEGADVWQQTIGRTHRPGQTADEVTVDVFVGCGEHINAWRKALSGARAIRDTTGGESKLLIADIDWPTDYEIHNLAGSRWRTGTAQ